MRKFMTKKEVLEATGFSYTTVWKLMTMGEFPRSVQLAAGRESVRWYADEIENWIGSRPRRRLKCDPDPASAEAE